MGPRQASLVVVGGILALLLGGCVATAVLDPPSVTAGSVGSVEAE